MLSAALSYMLYFPNSLANFCLLHTNCKNASSLRRQLKSTATQFPFFLREKFKNNKLFSAMLSISFPWESLCFYIFCLSVKIENMNASLPKKLSKLSFWNVPFNVFYDFVFLPLFALSAVDEFSCNASFL